MKKVLILAYHAIHSDRLGIKTNAADKVNSIREADFMLQLECLRDNKVPVVALADVLNNAVENDFSVAITFDDGFETDYLVAYPLLMAFGFKASFFPCFLNMPPDSKRWEQVKEMRKNGYEIGAHGVSHRYLDDLDENEQFYEMEYPKKSIEEKIGYPVEYFSCPGGRYTKRIAGLAKKAGYKFILSTRTRVNYPSNYPFVLDRWSIKSSTTINEFQKMVTNDPFCMAKNTFRSGAVKLGMKILGNTASMKIYRMINGIN
jgi:peptidoglycan/xylan/chitin deacetylase (PgdA/CDA1 family)